MFVLVLKAPGDNFLKNRIKIYNDELAGSFTEHSNIVVSLICIIFLIELVWFL